jgi:hypothetical protein
MERYSNLQIVGSPKPGSPGPASRTMRKYQLAWNPSFFGERSSVYVLGEDIRFANGGFLIGNPSAFFNPNVQSLIDLGVNNGLILPLNTNIALAQEYSPSIKNKVVTYETVGGNSITTFGEAIRQIGLRIRIIRLSETWQVYYKGLEAISHLSGNQSRYYGGLYLTGYDSFGNDDTRVSYRYKVTIMSLDFNFKSDSNTTLTADLKMVVNQELSKSRGKWGQL